MYCYLLGLSRGKSRGIYFSCHRYFFIIFLGILYGALFVCAGVFLASAIGYFVAIVGVSWFS